MDIRKIKDFLGRDWTAVQEHIASALKSDISLLNSTNDSILSQSGKQLRPMLALVFARACAGKTTESGLRYAAAAELLHNATLLHDDVADGSELRRGKPTVMSLMGSSVSVLVGDYWLVRAMDILLQGCETDSEVLRIFANTLSDLAEGEMLQLQKAQSGDTDEKDYLRIIYNKTASLFEAACVSAVISVGGSRECLNAARDYAVALGLAFQIKDDILDYSGTNAVGKPLGVDILEQKITLPLLGAMNHAPSEKQKEVRGKVADIVGHPEYRDDILEFVMENGGLDYARGRLEEYVEEAVRALDVLPESEEKGFLVELAHYTALRDK